MADLIERLRRFKKNTPPSEKGGLQEPPSPTPSSSVLPDSLRAIPGLTRARDLIGLAEKREREKNRFLQSIGVYEERNELGAFGVRDRFYPNEQLVFPPEDIRGPELALQTRDESLASIGPSEILFLDTETTGLAGGTGTVPFLVGLGFFEEKGFRVRQFLMRDYDEEPAVLFEINRFLERYPAIGSYNGKGFDVPILQARFLLNRFRSRIGDLPHADFLYPARRLWRGWLPNCTLLTVEGYLTGQPRENDIPGEQIPSVFFDFLRGLRLSRMEPVLNHNAEDVKTLALIASRGCRMLRQPPPDDMHCVEMAAVGRMFAAVGDWDRSFEYLEQAMNDETIPSIHRLPICRTLSGYYKRLKRLNDACAVWTVMACEFEDLAAPIELAKYYEHKMKDYLQALHYTNQALDLVRFILPHVTLQPSAASMIEKQLLYRRDRLMRKNGSIQQEN